MKLIRRIAKSASCVYVCVRVAFEIDKKIEFNQIYTHISSWKQNMYAKKNIIASGEKTVMQNGHDIIRIRLKESIQTKFMLKLLKFK